MRIKPFIPAAKKILEWEETGEIRILNNKQIPTRVPFIKGDTAKCLDLMMITKGLKTEPSITDLMWTVNRLQLEP